MVDDNNAGFTQIGDAAMRVAKQAGEQMLINEAGSLTDILGEEEADMVRNDISNDIACLDILERMQTESSKT